MRPARANSVRPTAASRDSGTILAIGRPRSVTITSCPAFTWARYSLSFALSLATPVLFTMISGHHLDVTIAFETCPEGHVY